jgi:hypothetical protein
MMHAHTIHLHTLLIKSRLRKYIPYPFYVRAQALMFYTSGWVTVLPSWHYVPCNFYTEQDPSVNLHSLPMDNGCKSLAQHLAFKCRYLNKILHSSTAMFQIKFWWWMDMIWEAVTSFKQMYSIIILCNQTYNKVRIHMQSTWHLSSLLQ